MDNLDLYKFQTICPSKDMVKKMGRYRLREYLQIMD